MAETKGKGASVNPMGVDWRQSRRGVGEFPQGRRGCWLSGKFGLELLKAGEVRTHVDT
jgi:hypothetical protein